MGLEDNADGRSRCAIVRGERVLARVEKNVDSLALYLATLRLGAIYVPLNPAYTPRETQHFIEVDYVNL
uniref:AMP-dependent synthetase/ligase domain-containing protein n=1 Tax=Parascaris equorum TaxID=6256 RepID=A0A914RW03_PAREQ